MRRSAVVFIAFAATCFACGGDRRDSSPPPATPVPFNAITLEKAADSGQVDKVGDKDGSLKPDGVNDLAFSLSIDGPVKAVFLVAVDATGRATGKYQADTLVGEQEVPKEISTKWGGNTAGIGVSERGALVNSPDGSLPALPTGPHGFVLYISKSKTLTAGTKLRVYVQRPDNTVDAGGSVVIE